MMNPALIRTQHLRDPCAGRAGLVQAEEVNGCRSGCSQHTLPSLTRSVPLQRWSVHESSPHSTAHMLNTFHLYF